METVLIVSANRFFCESLYRLLRREKTVRVLELGVTPSRVAEEVPRVNPQIAILTAESDDPDCTTAHVLHAGTPQVKILMVGMPDDQRTFFRAVRAGAVGYLLRDLPGKEIVSAVRQVGRDGVVCPPHLEWALFQSIAAGPAPNSVRPAGLLPKLTGRERELTGLLCQGLTNKEIAARLNLSVPTVKTHIHNLLQKTDSENRADLMRTLELLPETQALHATA